MRELIDRYKSYKGIQTERQGVELATKEGWMPEDIARISGSFVDYYQHNARRMVDVAKAANRQSRRNAAAIMTANTART